MRDELRQQRRAVKRLRVENEILREAAEPLIHHAPARERFAFVHARRGRFSSYRMCQVLATDSCNYHGWASAKARRTERDLDDRKLTQRIFEIPTTHPEYGAERVTRELKYQGIDVGRRRVTRLVRERRIKGVTRRRRRNLTKPDKAAAAVPDLIRRDVTAPIIAPHMRAGLAVEAITAAHRTSLVAGNAIMHTGRRSQYHSRAHRNALQCLEIRRSTSRTGSCLDGAAAESFFATIKAEKRMSMAA